MDLKMNKKMYKKNNDSKLKQSLTNDEEKIRGREC